MTSLEWLMDGVIMLALIVLAIRVLLIPDLFRAVFLFIVFGLLMALAWVRLDAPDIALAEAAIGAGLTGVLLLDAVRHMHRPVSPTTQPPSEKEAAP
jgi:energy-converting hydrogenase B subunit D